MKSLTDLHKVGINVKLNICDLSNYFYKNLLSLFIYKLLIGLIFYKNLNYTFSISKIIFKI